MASILPFIRPRGDFDEETTRLMGEAFDAARAALHDQGQPEIVYGINRQAHYRGRKEGRA